MSGFEGAAEEEVEEEVHFQLLQRLDATTETPENKVQGDRGSTGLAGVAAESEAVGIEGGGNVITALAFDADGHYLAAGMRDGRIALYAEEGTPTGPAAVSLDAEAAEPAELADAAGASMARDVSSRHFEPLLSFQSHRPEFDYLKSLEIEECINCVAFCQSPGRAPWLLSTNGKAPT